ncbi:hypothetical protein SRABI106_02755 [Rahnella aquatilis]|nr:hypothetical protein SRABI106_02755 [Rahnella aquatilis]
MGNRHNGAFEVMQEAFQPCHGFGIQVVGRFVEQQHVRLFEQQAAKCHTAAFTTGQVCHFRIPVRQTQRIGGTFELAVQVMAIMCLNDFFQLALFGRQFVEISVRFGVQRIHFIETF